MHSRPTMRGFRSIRIMPGLHFTLGCLLNKLGRYKEAIASHKEAVRVEPDDVYAHKQIALA